MSKMLPKKQLSKLQKLTRELPSNHLLERYKEAHHELVTQFFILRNQSVLLGKCLKARFGGGGGNLAEVALKRGEIDEYEYQIIWALTDAYQEIFTLIQMNWEAIAAVTRYLKEPCLASEVSLFFEILREHYDVNFSRCAEKKYTFTPDHAKARASKLREQVCVVTQLELPEVPMSPEERTKCGLNRKHNDFFWLPQVLEIGKENGIRKPILAKYYRNCWKALSKVADIHEYWASQHRGKERARAIKWDEGKLSIGSKGGYVSITKLNQSFSDFVR